MIIGLCGAQGAGKDTVGGILESKHGFVKLAFASAIKDILSALFSWPRNMLEGLTRESREWRETPNEYWSNKLAIPDFSPRRAMQIVGTDLFRNHLNQDIWINIIENKIMTLRESDPNVNIVITDCRFANEFDMIRKFSEAMIIKIVKDTHIEIGATHSSENDWTNVDCEILQNNGSIESLGLNLDAMIYSSLSASSS
jgi:small nuclear ribonucleoprotein (snRNP)-like protein